MPMNTTYRVYLIGYEPPGEPEPTKVQIMERMENCDCCFTVDGNRPWRIGEVITPDKDLGGPGDGAGLRLGTPYRCVGHEHQGKIVLVAEAEREGGMS